MINIQFLCTANFRFFVRAVPIFLIAALFATPFETAIATTSIQNNQNKDCPIRDISKDPTRAPEYPKRFQFNFGAITEAAPGEASVSNCVTVTGLQGLSKLNVFKNTQISINRGAWQSGTVPISEGDTIQLKTIASSVPGESLTESLAFNFNPTSYNAELWAEFRIWTANTGRDPTTFSVGPARAYKEVSEIADKLVAGDIVELDPGQYKPFILKKSGTSRSPITIRGQAGQARPVISGNNVGADFEGTTVEFYHSHHVILENVEVTGGREVCIRIRADQVSIRNVFVHDCDAHGILGTDTGNGTNIIDRSEVARVGRAAVAGGKLKHAIYGASDRDQFPDAVLRVQHSFVHQFRGNGIKSRCNRNEIYFNWVESLDDPVSFYNLQLVGYQEYQTLRPLVSDIVGNVFIVNSGNFMQLGSDGTGGSRGRYRLVNNTIVFSNSDAPNRFGPYSKLLRLDGELESVYLQNNAFFRQNAAPYQGTIISVGASIPVKWNTGKALISGTNNSFAAGSQLGTIALNEFKNTIFSSSGLASLKLSELDLTPIANSSTAKSGEKLSKLSSDYSIPNSLDTIRFKTPSKRPTSGELLVPVARTPDSVLPIGSAQ
jgi:hypothetical protein